MITCNTNPQIEAITTKSGTQSSTVTFTLNYYTDSMKTITGKVKWNKEMEILNVRN